MGNPIFCTPNYIKSTFFTPVLAGGDWEANDWLDYLTDDFFINKAISVDASTASTKFDVDLGVTREIKTFVIPNSNIDNDGLIRVRASDTIAWSGVVVNGVNALNSVTLNLTALDNITIKDGEVFKIAGDDKVYMSTENQGFGNNLLTKSEEFDHSNWTKTGLQTVTSDATSAPDGDTTADLLTEDTSTGQHVVYQDVTATGGSVHVAVIYIKSNGRDEVEFFLDGGAGGDGSTIEMRVDLTDATINSSGATGGSSSFTSATATLRSDGWVKLVLIGSPDSTSATIRTHVRLYNVASTYTGDGVSGVYSWGAMLYQGTSEKDYCYTDTVAISSLSQTLSIKRSDNSGTGLAVATTGAEAVTCSSGNFLDDTQGDTGSIDYRPIIYGYTGPWGGPTVFYGKETEENLATLDLPNPFIHIFGAIVLARYWRVEIDNTTNPDGFVSLDDCFIASGFTPSTGISLGSVLGIKSNTSAEQSAGGVEAFNAEKSGRYVDMTIPGLTVGEAVGGFFDIERNLDIDKDFFFIFDEDDTILMNRRSFVARFEQIGGQQFVAFDWVDNKVRIKEKLG